MTTEELIAYYSDLLIMQYNNKPKAIATVQSYVGELVADQIIQQVSDGFDLETAIGEQLTMLGTYRNAPRNIYGLTPDKDFFVYVLYSDVDPTLVKGYATYDGDPDPSWYFILYSDVNNPLYYLSDSELRTLIKYLAETNSEFQSVGSIDNILFKYFGVYLELTDNEDMTITYTHDPTDPNLLFDIVNNLGQLPHPAGVTVLVA